jgi:hypothetical protein
MSKLHLRKNIDIRSLSINQLISLFHLQVHPYICFGPLKDHYRGVQNYVQSTPTCINSVITSSSVKLYAGLKCKYA